MSSQKASLFCCAPGLMVLFMSAATLRAQQVAPCGQQLSSDAVYQGVPALSNDGDQGTGESCDGKGSYGLEYQCVEYVKRFYKVALGVDTSGWRGNADQYFATASAKGLAAYANGGQVKPAPNDVLVFKGEPYGHVAIVTNVTDTSISFIEENWSRAGVATLALTNSSSTYTVAARPSRKTSYQVQGWLRLPSGNAHSRAFNDAAGLIDLGNHFDNDGSQPMTLELWVKLTSQAYQQAPNIFLFGKWAIANAPGYQIEIFGSGHLAGGSLGFVMLQAFNNQLFVLDNPAFNFGDDQWHYIAITYDGSKSPSGIGLYVDGSPRNKTVFVNSFIGSSSNDNDAVVSGRIGGPPSAPSFPNLIDEVRIWNIVRSPSDIVNDMATISTGSEPGLIGYYRFENSDQDSSRSGFNGSPAGNVTFSTIVPFN